MNPANQNRLNDRQRLTALAITRAGQLRREALCDLWLRVDRLATAAWQATASLVPSGRPVQAPRCSQRA